VGLFYVAAILLAEFSLVGVGAGLPAHLGLLAFAFHLAWQIRRMEGADDALALRLFRSNGGAGFLLFVGLLAENMLFYFL
jgi:4-hydroxybenzoate polyprenyltransferase